jgi:hypothetical protein
MFYPPTIPINFLTFLLLSLFLGGVSLAFAWKTGDRSPDSWVVHGLTGILASLSSLLLLTAVGFIPDDWSATRMSVPLSLFYGYPLYSELESHPANANFYLPFGFLGFLPAAYLGYLFHSPSVCLLLGWATTMLFYFFPFYLFIRRFEINNKIKLNLFLLCVIITLSTPSLRYVATMIHVDACGFLCIATALALTLPIPSTNVIPSKVDFVISGIALGISVFIKQTFWPLTLVLFLLIILHYRNASKNFIISFFITVFSCICSIVALFDIRTIWSYAFNAASSAPDGCSALQSLVAFLNINWPLLFASSTLFCLLSCYKRSNFQRPFINSIIGTIFIFLCAFPLSIYTFTKLGSDSNHFIFPSALLLFLSLYFLSQIVKNNPKNNIIFLAVISLFLFPSYTYIKTYCGWYLWVNNPHEVAYRVCKKYPDHSLYFPWQPMASLLAYGKMYHIDQAVFYEEVNGMHSRSMANIDMFLPKRPFIIALRPFGAPSFLSDKFQSTEINSLQSIPELIKWRKMQVK